MFQQNSVGSLGRQWLWLEMCMGLLRLLLSSTVIVSLHLWKICTKQHANKAARWSCSCLGYKRYTNSPGACLPGSFIFITSFMSKEMAPRCQSTHPSALEAPCITSSSEFFQCFLLVSGGWLWAEQCLYFRPTGTVLSTALGRILHF